MIKELFGKKNKQAPKKKGRNYPLKPHHAPVAQAITVPKKGVNETPRVIELTDEQARQLSGYINGQRAVAKHKQAVIALLEVLGKIAYKDCTLTPKQAVTYLYPSDLQAEIDAVDEKKKAAREAGEVDTKVGATSIDFADKLAKAKNKAKPKAQTKGAKG